MLHITAMYITCIIYTHYTYTYHIHMHTHTPPHIGRLFRNDNTKKNTKFIPLNSGNLQIVDNISAIKSVWYLEVSLYMYPITKNDGRHKYII